MKIDSVTVRFIATPPAFSECLCFRCNRPLGARAASIWDGIGDDGSVELELVCEKCGHKAIRTHTGEWLPGWARTLLRILRVVVCTEGLWAGGVVAAIAWAGAVGGAPWYLVLLAAAIGGWILGFSLGSIVRKIRELD